MSKLREAAQALLDAYVADTERWMTPYWDALRDALQEDALVCLTETHQQLDEALAEKSEEYELLGRIFGTYGGRWVFIPDNKHFAWPEGMAVYARRIKR